jgi:hypothetical protein
MVTLNDGDLCREVLRRWSGSGWIRVAPHSPLIALTGPEFSPRMTLSEFCGRSAEELLEADATEPPAEAEDDAQEEEKDDEHS